MHKKYLCKLYDLLTILEEIALGLSIANTPEIMIDLESFILESYVNGFNRPKILMISLHRERKT